MGAEIQTLFKPGTELLEEPDRTSIKAEALFKGYTWSTHLQNFKVSSQQVLIRNTMRVAEPLTFYSLRLTNSQISAETLDTVRRFHELCTVHLEMALTNEIQASSTNLKCQVIPKFFTFPLDALKVSIKIPDSFWIAPRMSAETADSLQMDFPELSPDSYRIATYLAWLFDFIAGIENYLEKDIGWWWAYGVNPPRCKIMEFEILDGHTPMTGTLLGEAQEQRMRCRTIMNVLKSLD
jgi:hypothetical protein